MFVFENLFLGTFVDFSDDFHAATSSRPAHEKPNKKFFTNKKRISKLSFPFPSIRFDVFLRGPEILATNSIDMKLMGLFL
jgi:hypothetical protein